LEYLHPACRTLQEPSKFTGSYVHDRFPDATECAMAVAFKGAASTDPDSIPLMVMQTMLGGLIGDRLVVIGGRSCAMSSGILFWV